MSFNTHPTHPHDNDEASFPGGFCHPWPSHFFRPRTFWFPCSWQCWQLFAGSFRRRPSSQTTAKSAFGHQAIVAIVLVAVAPWCHVLTLTRPQVIERFTLEDLPAENGQDSTFHWEANHLDWDNFNPSMVDTSHRKSWRGVSQGSTAKVAKSAGERGLVWVELGNTESRTLNIKIARSWDIMTHHLAGKDKGHVLAASLHILVVFDLGIQGLAFLESKCWRSWWKVLLGWFKKFENIHPIVQIGKSRVKTHG